MHRWPLLPLALLLPFSTWAQSVALTDGTLSIEAGTKVELIGPLEWSIAPGAQVVNDGTIELGPEAILLEAEGAPITGAGTEHAQRTLPAGSGAVEPGGLGLSLASPDDLGVVDITRGHDVITATGGIMSIARWYELSTTAGQAALVELTMDYDPTELNGADANDLILHNASTLAGPWAPVDGSLVAGPHLLAAEGTGPWGHLTAFPEIITQDHELAASAGFVVGPTLMDGPVSVRSTGTDRIGFWELRDAAGRIVRSGNYREGQQDLVIDPSDLSPGLFMLTVNGTRTWKVIKP